VLKPASGLFRVALALPILVCGTVIHKLARAGRLARRIRARAEPTPILSGPTVMGIRGATTTTGNSANNTTTDASAPVQVKNLTGIATIGAGGSHSLFASSTGNPSAVDLNTSGRLGDAATTNACTAVQVSGLQDVRAVAAGGYTYGRDGLRSASAPPALPSSCSPPNPMGGF
jgi:hypothetical protein